MRTLILFYLSLLLLMEVHSQTFPHVCFMDQTLANHSYVDLSEVGSDESGSDSVLCYTDLSTCCTSAQSPVHRGNWYFPDGARLLFSSDVGDIYEQRAAQRVDLRRRNNANSPTGIYRCDIPTNGVHDDTDISVRDTVYVGLYTASGGDITISESIVLTVDSDLNGASPQFTLAFISTGGPATTVTWTRDSTNVTQGTTETVLNDPVTAEYTHTLTVTGRLPGIYACTVANNKPNSAANASITIEEASPPTSLSSVKRASTFLTVLWTPMGDTTGHVIFYNEHNTTNTYSEGCPNSWNEINVIGGGGIYDIAGLTPNVSYNICITGTSEHFNSDCKCLQVVASFLWVNSMTTTSITVSWTSGGSGNVISYYLMWGPVGQDDQPNTMTITITDGSTNHTVTGLEENTEYHFTVIAEADSSTDRGESNTITATTVSGLPVQICLSGFLNCSELMANFPGANLADDISHTILRESCPCDIPAENNIIVNGETVCLSELPNSIFFNATIVDYFDANSSELRAGIQSWASEGPVISILGVLMTIVWGDCISCPDLATGLCDREEFSCIFTQPSTGIVQIAVTNTFSSTAPTNYIENTQTLTSSSAPRSTEMPNPPPVENTAGTQMCDCTQSLSSGILGLSVGLGIGAGLVAFLVAGGVVLIPFCIAKRRRRNYVLKQSDATLDATIIPNVAYSLSPINRDRVPSTDQLEYDYPLLRGSIVARPQRPRQPTQTDGKGDYEVGTPLHIRLMRIRQQEQESCLGQGSRQGDEEPQEEDEDYRRSRRYTEAPTDT